MPLYDYACETCALTFEVSRSFKEADLPAHCPICDRPAKKQITTPMMTFTRGARADGATPSEPGGGSWFHHGHSHGPGSGAHTH